MGVVVFTTSVYHIKSFPMHFKVELLFIDQDDELKDVSYFTYIEASTMEEAIQAARKRQQVERPDLLPSVRWVWNAYPTNEQTSNEKR